jgi:predicted dienelactone hydrolase
MGLYEPFGRGQLSVDVRSVAAHDQGRNRRFPIEVWQPVVAPTGDVTAGSGVHPLIIYSHHSGGDRRAASYLCTHLASHGYVVAALDHSEVVAAELALPADGTPHQRVEWARRTWAPARVRDVRFLIDLMLERTTVDAGRIGIVGHSFGGWTALATPEQDSRVGAVVALAPAGSEPPPPGIIPVTLGFQWGRDVATMYLVAEDDASLPLDGMHQLYERTPAPKRMLILRRADHLHFIDDVEHMHEAFRTTPLSGPVAQIQRRMRPISELCSGEESHLMVRGLTVAHFDATLRGSLRAQRFLNDDLAAELADRGIAATIIGP